MYVHVCGIHLPAMVHITYAMINKHVRRFSYATDSTAGESLVTNTHFTGQAFSAKVTQVAIL